MSYQSADMARPAPQASPQTGARPGMPAQSQTTPFLLALFFLSLIIPLQIEIGTLKLGPSTIALLLLFVPSLIKVASGQAGRLRIPDFAVFMICVWSSLSLVVNHGLGLMIETIGLLWLETLGAYLVGRAYIRTPKDFYATAKFMLLMLLLMAPFALIETTTGQNVTLQVFDVIGTTYADVLKEQRLGFDRVQGPFAHPILFGVFFGGMIGITHYTLGYKQVGFARYSRTLLVAVISGLSLSSGPLSAIVMQFMMITWDSVLRSYRRRWVLLGSMAGAAYLIVDLISSRSPFAVFIGYAALNPATAYNRLNIWYWGMINVRANPIFGLGLKGWVREPWMPSSVDMHWLVPAMRHGYPAWFFYGLLMAWLFIRLARLKTTSDMIDSYRKGYLISLFGIFVAGWTVYLWDSVVVFLMFLIGAGIWFVDYKAETAEAEDGPAPESEKRVRYTRFSASEAAQGPDQGTDQGADQAPDQRADQRVDRGAGGMRRGTAK